MAEKDDGIEAGELEWEAGLTDPERIYVLRYCTHYNKTRAYKEALGKTGKDGSPNDGRNALIMHKRLERAISKCLAGIVAEARGELEAQLLTIYRVRGSYNPLDLYDKEGNLKTPEELGPLAYVIDEVQAYEVKVGRGKAAKKKIVYVPKKLADRQANLDKLDRIIQLIKPEDRVGEGSGGGYVLLPQNMTLEQWDEQFGRRNNDEKKGK